MSRAEHLDLFERASPPNSTSPTPATAERAHRAARSKTAPLEIGAIHTYIELYARLVVDLMPNVVLLCAIRPTAEQGNLYTGPSTEDTPIIAEAAAFRDGIVDRAGQRNRRRPERPAARRHSRRWVDFVVQADKPFFLEPLFTRDPAAHQADAGAAWR